MADTHFEAQLDKAIDVFRSKYHETQVPSQSTIDGWLEDKGEEYVIALFEKICSLNKDLDSPVGYMRAVVNSDWQPATPSYTKGRKKDKKQYVSPIFKAAKERLPENDNCFEVLNHEGELEHMLVEDDLNWLYRNINYHTLETEEEKNKHFWIYYGMLKFLGLTRDLATFTQYKRDIYGDDKYKHYYSVYDEAVKEEKAKKEAQAESNLKQQLKEGVETMAKSSFRKGLEENIVQLTETKQED